MKQSVIPVVLTLLLLFFSCGIPRGVYLENKDDIIQLFIDEDYSPNQNKFDFLVDIGDNSIFIDNGLRFHYLVDQEEPIIEDPTSRQNSSPVTFSNSNNDDELLLKNISTQEIYTFTVELKQNSAWFLEITFETDNNEGNVVSDNLEINSEEFENQENGLYVIIFANYFARELGEHDDTGYKYIGYFEVD